MSEHYTDALEQATRVLWAFNLNTPANPPDTGQAYNCPAERYLGNIQEAVRVLEDARQHAFNEIPEQIKQRAGWLEKSHVSAVDEMASAAPEIRRFWAVRAALFLVSNLYAALEDEGRPHKRVILPPLAKRRRS